MNRVSGRMKGWKDLPTKVAPPPSGDSNSLSTGAVFKYATDIEGEQTTLPKRLEDRDFVLQVYDKASGQPVVVGWTYAPGVITWEVANPPLTGQYRVVVMW